MKHSGQSPIGSMCTGSFRPNQSNSMTLKIFLIIINYQICLGSSHYLLAMTLLRNVHPVSQLSSQSAQNNCDAYVTCSAGLSGMSFHIQPFAFPSMIAFWSPEALFGSLLPQNTFPSCCAVLRGCVLVPPRCQYQPAIEEVPGVSV